MFQEVDEDVIAQVVGAGEERPAAVHLSHSFDELAEVAIWVEHEDIDTDVFLGGSSDFFQGGFYRFGTWRIVEVGLPAGTYVCGWFSVCDHDDLFGATLSS